MLLALVFTIAVAVVSSESNEVAHARFYRDFAQIYRQGKAMPSTDNPAIDFYRFEFALDEYSSITDESMTMLYADVIERTVVFHAYPNFETKGQRYFYRRDLKEDDLIEIELIEPEELLFRQVDHPERYFYLNSFEKILYKDKVPRKPFYEILFKCNRTKSNAGDQRSPMLSYVDQAFKWTARYTLDLPKDGSKNVTKIYGYADIHNVGTRDLIFASAEVITGDVAMSDVETPFKDSRDDFPMNRLALPSGLTLTGQSVKSVPLFRDSVQVEKFFTYSSKFSLTNSTGMLTMMFNITSLNQNLPIGRLFFIRDTKFFGEMQLPSMKVGETGIFLLNEDSNATFRRRVTMIGGSLDGPSVTYRVSYDFDYGKTPRDVPLQFVETFRRYSSFQVKNLSHPGFQVTQTTVDGELLAEKSFSYEITIPKMKVQEKQKV